MSLPIKKKSFITGLIILSTIGFSQMASPTSLSLECSNLEMFKDGVKATQEETAEAAKAMHQFSELSIIIADDWKSMQYIVVYLNEKRQATFECNGRDVFKQDLMCYMPIHPPFGSGDAIRPMKFTSDLKNSMNFKLKMYSIMSTIDFISEDFFFSYDCLSTPDLPTSI